MRKRIDDSPWNRGYREYFWFALILIVVLIGSAIRGTVSGETPTSSSLAGAQLGSAERQPVR
jgi:hypothetical protein